jgi:hypothetical protein
VQSIADHVQNVQQVLLVNMERSAANDCAV